MKATDLMRNVVVKGIVNFADREISAISTDSRTCPKGALFVCLTGGNNDGHDYAAEACENGAAALLVERPVEGVSLPQFLVGDTRLALAKAAANFYRNPAEKMNLVTIVGTNGKTSTAEILSEIFRRAGKLSATIGTLGYKVGEDRRAGVLTTPDPVELHATLADMASRGVEYVFLEASAHAIYYRKLAGIKAKASVFTNLSQDHLDFFGTMERYAEVKRSYFHPDNTVIAVVNSDDECGRRILRSEAVPTISYGLDNPADVFAIDVEEGENGLSFLINAFDRLARVETPLCGRFNVYNVMAATATAMYLGIDLPMITGALKGMHPVLGRYESLTLRGRRVIVDFAHTPDGLENLLSAVRKEGGGKVVTVFGCGGDRDKSKRPVMGRIASEYSDYTIITDDNPRSEDELAIAEEIRAGILADGTTEIVLDRREAIRRAFELTSEGDRIVIAGKGHENYIEIKGEKIPYNDLSFLQELYR